MTIQNGEADAYQMITQRLDVVDGNRIRAKLSTGERVNGFWGTAPTGKPHIGYLVPLIKIAEFIAAGVDFKILIANMYAFLMNHDAPMKTVDSRARFYAKLLTSILKSLGVPPSKIEIVNETSYSMKPNFWRDYLRLYAATSQETILSVGLEVTGSTMMGPMLCPGSQALSESYTGSDFELGGQDQRGMFEFSRKLLPQIGIEPASHLIAAMIPGLKSGKMSSSGSADNKIMFSDEGPVVEAKVAGADATQRDPSLNPITACFQHIVFPAHELGIMNTDLVEIRKSNGTTKVYTSYESLEADFLGGLTDLGCIRSLLAATLNRILGPVRQDYATDEDWQVLDRQVYSN